MDVPAPKAPGRAGTQKSRAWLHILSFVTGGAVTASVSGLASAASYGARSAPHQCPIQGLPLCTVAGFPSAAACCPCSSPKPPRQPASLTPQPCLHPRVQRRRGDVQHPSQHRQCHKQSCHLPPSSTWQPDASSGFGLPRSPFSQLPFPIAGWDAIAFEGLDVDPAHGYVDAGLSCI